jgi:predicted MFS family arabinose efflux permease
MVFLIGVGTSLFTPAILSSPPLLVPENKIIALNGLLDSTLSISSILGAVLSVFLLNFVDLQGLILINAICFLVAFFLQLGLKKITIENLDNNQEEPHVSPITVLKKYPDIGKMLLSFLILNLILAPIFVLIPWYVDNVYKGDSSSLSIIEGAMGLGAFLMGIVISITKFEVKEKDRVKMIAIISFIFGICFTLFSQTNATYQAAIILFLFGSFLTFLNIQVLTYFQTEASEGDVPAIMTSVNLISNAAMPLSLSLSGIVFPLVDVKQLALFSGISIILIAFLMPTIIRGKSQ